MIRVGVVEDEPLISTMLEINLTRAGYAAAVFRDAESFLESLDGAAYDLVLLDLMLPGIQGDEALRRIRARGLAMPVFMLTARRDRELKVGALDDGADDYVTKPFDMAELLARIRARLRRDGGTAD